MCLNYSQNEAPQKNNLLSKVVKCFLALHNWNANVERRFSDNKNTLSSEQTKLSAETLTGLRRANEHPKSCGVHNVNTLT